MKNSISKKSKLSIFLLCSILISTFWGSQGIAENREDCPVPLTESEVYGKSCPIVGEIGNVHIAVPTHFALGPVAYKDIDIWNKDSYKNSPTHPTVNTKIDNFAIRIRLNNFNPINTHQDLNDYSKLGEIRGWDQPPENRWITTGFSSLKEKNKRFPFKEVVDHWVSGSVLGGKYRPATSYSDLQHFESLSEANTKQTHYDIFFDFATETFINCETVLIAIPPYEPLPQCRLDFIIPTLNLKVEVLGIYHRDDLLRWREIEAGITRVFTSFIVSK